MKIVKGNLNSSPLQNKEFCKIIRAIQQGDSSICAIGIKTDGWIKAFSESLGVVRGCSFDILLLLQPVSEEFKTCIYPCVLANKNGLIIDFSDEIKKQSKL
jgi:hypothetical protein